MWKYWKGSSNEEFGTVRNSWKISKWKMSFELSFKSLVEMIGLFGSLYIHCDISFGILESSFGSDQ